MKKIIVIIVLALTLFFCIALYEKTMPPTLTIEAQRGHIEATQSSYCWASFFSASCVDMVEPSHMQVTSLSVQAGEIITLQFSEEPLADTLTISQIDGGNVTTNTSFITPNMPGSYMYVVSAQWSRGSASYVFSLQVHA